MSQTCFRDGAIGTPSHAPGLWAAQQPQTQPRPEAGCAQRGPGRGRSWPHLPGERAGEEGTGEEGAAGPLRTQPGRKRGEAARRACCGIPRDAFSLEFPLEGLLSLGQFVPAISTSSSGRLEPCQVGTHCSALSSLTSRSPEARPEQAAPRWVREGRSERLSRLREPCGFQPTFDETRPGTALDKPSAQLPVASVSHLV